MATADHAAPAAVSGATLWLPPLLVLVALLLPYVTGIARWRRARRRWSGWRTVSFLAGAVLVAVALSPPLAGYAHASAQGHMAQHLLLGMYAPLGLVLGAPVTLLVGALPVRGRHLVAAALRSRLLHVLAHPITAALLSVGGLFLLYLTPLYAISAEQWLVHGVVNLHFVAAGWLFAWSVAGPDPAPRRPGMKLRVAALLLAAGAHAYLAKLLHARAPALPSGAGLPADEIQQAAQLMYYGGDVAELLLAAALSAGWYGRRVPRAAPVGASGQAHGGAPAA